MPVLIITSENTAFEKEIAQKIAQRMSYSTLDRQLLHEIADKYAVPHKKMIEAMTITPSILKRMPAKAWNYFISCVELEVLEHLLADNCVCRGLGAHLYVMAVSHVLKVRLIGGHGTEPSSGQAGAGTSEVPKTIVDQEFKNDKWAMEAFHHRTSDPGLYDMVINMDQMQVDEVVENFSTTLGYPRFKAMTYSKNSLADMVLAARVKNPLLKILTDIRVSADNGTVVVTTTSVKREKTKKIDTIKRLAGEIDGIVHLEVHWNKDVLAEASTSFR
ncbi:cytidylate kinase-like family protein [Desulfobacula sp.]